MKFLKSSLVLISAISVVFAATSARQLPKSVENAVQKVDLGNGAQEMVMGDQGQGNCMKSKRSVIFW